MACSGDQRRGCKFWLPKKNRFCANTLLSVSSQFCGNHTDTETTQWIQCPIDPSHNVLLENLEGHKKKCPLLKQANSLSLQPYYRKGINAGSNHDLDDDTIITTSEMKRKAVFTMTATQFNQLLTKIRSLHAFLCADIHDSYKIPQACDIWINRQIDRKLPFQEKHVQQQASILGNLEDFGIIKNNVTSECNVNKQPSSDVPEAVVEFGAGRGYLTQVLADCYGFDKVVLVERKAYKLKADRSLRQKESLILERLRIDIEDLNLNAVESLQSVPYLAIGKHLCGPATDMTLRCCLVDNYKSGSSRVERCRVGGDLRGLAVATCCHHLCQWKHYINKSYLTSLGISKEDFHAMTWFTSWAVDADHSSDLSDAAAVYLTQDVPPNLREKDVGEEKEDAEEVIKGLKAVERAAIGFMCKDIIDMGRLMWLKQQRQLQAQLVNYSHSFHRIAMNPEGTIVFTTVGRTQYGFDIFSLEIPSDFNFTHSPSLEQCLTDGISINFNGQFTNDQSLVFISERTGSPQIFLSRINSNKPAEKLPTPTESLFHDRPVIKDGRIYFISAHEPPQNRFTSWSAMYSTNLDDKITTRLTPYGVVDYSPAISPNGKFIAVASNGLRPWAGEFNELKTDIVVFKESDPSKRTVVCQHGGWPTWGDDFSLYFHRQAEDGWWSVFKIDFTEDLEGEAVPLRITPPGVHAFTPAAMHGGKYIVVATRRSNSKFRHIEIFDVCLQKFIPVTKLTNPDLHHYNPFVSPDSNFLGYHRFRGKSARGETIIPRVDFVTSPEKEIRMFRVNGNFPSSSPDGDFIAFNPELNLNTGLNIVKSDGSKKWTLFKGRTTFYNSWSPTEKNVIFTSIGPIFEKARTAVQIARVSFDLKNLDDDHNNETIPVDIKMLTKEDTGNNAFPACSPDGKFIVFRSGRSGHKNLFIMDAVNGEFDGGSIRQLTEGECIDTMPHWSPDGKLIAFSSNRHNPANESTFSIYLICPDGTGLRRIYVAGLEGSEEVDRERINHVCFSPDGEWLVFAANFDGVTAEPVSFPNQFQPYGEIYISRVDGSGLRRLTMNGYENGTPTWHTGNGVDLGRLGLSCNVGDELGGAFEEPLWIRSDF